MDQALSNLEISKEAAAYMAAGLRALAACDGLDTSELALIADFESQHGIDAADAAEFVGAGGGPLKTQDEKDVFLRSLLLLALADGSISSRESEWLDAVSNDLGFSADSRVQAETEAKKFLLGSLAGVRLFRDRAVAVGRQLGLSDDDINEVLGSEQSD